MLPVIQPSFDEGIALGKPLNEVFIVIVHNRDVKMMVASDKRRIAGKFPVYDGYNMCDLALG